MRINLNKTGKNQTVVSSNFRRVRHYIMHSNYRKTDVDNVIIVLQRPPERFPDKLLYEMTGILS